MPDPKQSKYSDDELAAMQRSGERNAARRAEADAIAAAAMIEVWDHSSPRRSPWWRRLLGMFRSRDQMERRAIPTDTDQSESEATEPAQPHPPLSLSPSLIALAELVRTETKSRDPLVTRESLSESFRQLYAEARASYGTISFRAAGIPATAYGSYREDLLVSPAEAVNVHLNVLWNDQRIIIHSAVVSDTPCDILVVLETEDGVPLGVASLRYGKPSKALEFTAQATGLDPTSTRWRIRILPLGVS